MNIINRVASWFGFVRSTAGDWKTPAAATAKAAAKYVETESYQPDKEFEELAARQVPNPVLAFQESIREKKQFNGQHVAIREAFLFKARVDADGKMLKGAALKKFSESVGGLQAQPYQIERVDGDKIEGRLLEAERTFAEHPARARESMESKRVAFNRLKESGLINDDMSFDGQYDPGQYTEYTPIMGGPYYKQLYLTDYLTMHARAFEAWNHNPLAKRIVKLLAQYAMGRGYKAISKNEKVQKAWDKFEKDNSIKTKIVRFWPSEYLVNGELMIDKVKWQSIDPSTIWDIVTDPDNIEDVYYYHQQYQTAYQQFTGKSVPGVPGSSAAKPMQFIIRQLPYDQVIHTKMECYSNEKRGRSKLFPILGWLKRIKDLYNAGVIKAWLQASWIYDDTIEGSQTDIDAHVAQYSQMPQPGSVFAHNKAITRTMLSPSSTGAAGDATAQEIIAFIGTAIGIPKEHLNLLGSAGTRATALVSSEPFTKVIEELQGDFEELLREMGECAMEQAGIKDFKPEDLEFIFPSVTKDVTSETVKNIMSGEASGYIAKETAASMYAGEMNITTYDFNAEQEKVKGEREKGMQFVDELVPPSRQPGQYPSPVHGEGKVAQQEDIKSL